MRRGCGGSAEGSCGRGLTPTERQVAELILQAKTQPKMALQLGQKSTQVLKNIVQDKLFIGTANVNRQWVRNVQKTPKVKLSMGGETFEGNARFLTDRAEHERAMAAIRRKSWIFRPIIELGRLE